MFKGWRGFLFVGSWALPAMFVGISIIANYHGIKISIAWLYYLMFILTVKFITEINLIKLIAQYNAVLNIATRLSLENVVLKEEMKNVSQKAEESGNVEKDGSGKETT